MRSILALSLLVAGIVAVTDPEAGGGLRREGRKLRRTGRRAVRSLRRSGMRTDRTLRKLDGALKRRGFGS